MQDLNRTQNFYFAQVAPDRVRYPRINFSQNKFVRTPLNVDIYCNTINAYCTKTNIFNNTNIDSSPRKQQGWYLSTNHDTNSDGEVTALTPSSNSVNATPSTPLIFTTGRNGLVVTAFTDCTVPMVRVDINASSTLSYNPQGNPPYYTVECTENNSSEWTGVGNAGNILEVKPTANVGGRVDW